MRIEPTSIDGCYVITPRVLKDERGSFVKTFSRDVFNDYGLVTEFAEEFYSLSHKGVLRGMHFQLPPHDHYKIAYCLSGKVLDAIVDLREGASTYGKAETIELDSDEGKVLYMVPGIAHGFYTLTDEVIMQYKVTSAYSSAHDVGIRWDSAGIPWPDSSPIISKRDQSFPSLSDFKTPFVYNRQSEKGI